MKKLLKKWQKILSSMCMSGIHYLEEEIVEKNTTNEEDKDEIENLIETWIEQNPD